MAAPSAKTVIDYAKTQVGTKESPKNSNNVKYNTEYYGKAVNGSNYPWCVVFLWWLFKHTGAGVLLYDGKKIAYSPTLATWFQQKKQWYTSPKAGDIVFYKFPGSNRINHVGIVIEVLKDGRIKTIEGNTSSSNDANGGAVEIRTRYTTSVVGYGRPKYEVKTTSTKPANNANTTNTSYPIDVFIKNMQKALGFPITGKADAALVKAAPTISIKKNQKHKVVIYVQKYLNYIGYDCGYPDGEFGPKTDKAVKAYQKKFMKKPDGEITSGATTWKKLFGLL